MIKAGLDIGSRTIALVELDESGIVSADVQDTTHNPAAECRRLLAKKDYASLTATGYGRHLAAELFHAKVITEIKAYALGARHAKSGCRAILDIGGQDVKVIALDEAGRVTDFEMNDRCAAGTGKFLEVMAAALGYSLAEFGEAALSATAAVKINSTCTVFAESEVVSLIARGEPRNNIALGLHEAAAGRVIAMLNRVGLSGDLFFAGGVARNAAMREIVSKRLGATVYVPDNPQIIGALGAALNARSN
ncbi:MAG: acyl-CoA dehydratase activase [Actinomycetota bacterium]